MTTKDNRLFVAALQHRLAPCQTQRVDGADVLRRAAQASAVIANQGFAAYARLIELPKIQALRGDHPIAYR